MIFDMEADAGSGFENVDADTFIVPRISIIQSNSPQVKDSKPEYNAEAREGMLLNTATQELYDGNAGIGIIVCTFKRAFLEWMPRETGGGLAGVHTPADYGLLNREIRETDKGNKEFVVGTENTLADTREHAVIVFVEGQKPFPALMSFSSTQISKSKQIMTIMNGIEVQGKKGPFQPPLFAHEWHLTTVSESNAKGDWKGYKFARLGMVSDAGKYNMAKVFSEQVKEGNVEAEGGEEGSQPKDADINGGKQQF
ncbi:MAG: hypothetical protein COA47_10000 [Robiginitomaculum sp.]|nr:MAG: hypothetical protein COA47_10000 [Robiginitomaculum sp.]